MFSYWLLYTIWAGGAVQFARRRAFSKATFAIMIGLTALFIGLRHEVGGDWFNYIGIYENLYFQPLPIAMTMTDPAYALLNWLSAQLDGGIWPVNLVCGGLFMFGLGRLASRQPNPALAILVAVPYFIIVVAMGYTRQAAAIGIICYALADASEKRIFQIIAMIGLAALFHKSAVLVLPMMLIPVARRNIAVAVVGSIAFFGLFSVLLAGASDRLITNYVEQNLESQGAAIRIAMNVVAAVLLFVFRQRFEFTPFMRSYWMANGALALLSVVGLVAVAASTAVDRLSLFLIPLQVVIFSQLPYALSNRGRALPSVLFAVLLYSFLVQFVWLNYADNNRSWLPYSTVLAPAYEQ